MNLTGTPVITMSQMRAQRDAWMHRARFWRVLFFVALAGLLVAVPLAAMANEDARNAAWCAEQNGVSVDELRARRGDLYERPVPGGRIDCVAHGYAIEADWAYKSDECAGQAARYAQATGLRPGCLLLVGERRHCRYIQRATAGTEGVWVDVGGVMYRLRVWWSGAEVCDAD